jgi:hypothetical protein
MEAACAWRRIAEQPPLAWLAVALILGNLLDAVFTFTSLQLHLVNETNPLMRWLYEGSPLTFLVAKLGCVQVGFQLLWAHRHVPMAQAAMAAGAVMYTFVVVYHLALWALIPSLLAS